MDNTLPMMVSVGTIGSANGSSLVRVGGTCVLCGIKAELAQPAVEQPDEGHFVPNVDLPALCSSNFRSGPPSDEAQMLSQWVYETWQNSHMLDLKQLCIDAGKLCWVLHADITCLNYDGSLPQACFTALVAALRNVRLPRIITGGSGSVPKICREETPKSLNLNCLPVAVSLAVSANQTVVCCPSGEEERSCGSLLTVVTLDKCNICNISKLGGIALQQNDLKNCYAKAFLHGEHIRELINCSTESLS